MGSKSEDSGGREQQRERRAAAEQQQRRTGAVAQVFVAQAEERVADEAGDGPSAADRVRHAGGVLGRRTAANLVLVRLRSVVVPGHRLDAQLRRSRRTFHLVRLPQRRIGEYFARRRLLLLARAARVTSQRRAAAAAAAINGRDIYRSRWEIIITLDKLVEYKKQNKKATNTTDGYIFSAPPARNSTTAKVGAKEMNPPVTWCANGDAEQVEQQQQPVDRHGTVRLSYFFFCRCR